MAIQKKKRTRAFSLVAGGAITVGAGADSSSLMGVIQSGEDAATDRPFVSDILPWFGALAGGTEVQITGANFGEYVLVITVTTRRAHHPGYP